MLVSFELDPVVKPRDDNWGKC
ncbi:MAG TPA: palindromic element RPE4 domain-containing protein [Rickettsia endosymbiont of Omalisus fontisbellaquei]|nr:palindromic element RPE4 domain-containing protein [Rickettsia endosymbiont of Omalisus fontisbellaquei]